MSRKYIRKAGIALLLATGLTLSACGSDGSDDSKSGDDNGSASSSGSSESGEELTEDDFAERIVDAQQEAKTAHMTMEMSAEGQDMKADGDIEVGESLDDTKLAMKMNAAGQDMDMRMIEGVMYMNMGQASQDKFIKFDLNDSSNPMGDQFGDLADQTDPSKQIEEMQKAMTKFEKTGEPEEMDGVEAQGYEIAVDPSKLDAMPEEAESQMPDTINYTMYVGPDDLMRRITMDIQGSEMTMDYSNWGDSVSIDKPSDSDVTEDMPGMPEQ